MVKEADRGCYFESETSERWRRAWLFWDKRSFSSDGRDLTSESHDLLLTEERFSGNAVKESL